MKIRCASCGEIKETDSPNMGVMFDKDDNMIPFYGYHNCKDGQMGTWIEAHELIKDKHDLEN